MSVTFRYFIPEDLPRLQLQEAQVDWLGPVTTPRLDITYGESLMEAGPAWTAISGEDVLCCAGFGELSPPHAVAWALLTDGIGTRMTAITRFARHKFDEARYRRIEAIVRADHAAGLRWAAAMGMVSAYVLRAWGPQSADHMLFERIAA